MENNLQAQVVAVVAGLCMLGGCQAPVPQLEYVEIGVDENKAKPIFGITLKNAGDSPVTITKCVPQMLSIYVFAVDSGPVQLPEKFEHHVELWETEQGLAIEAGEQAIIPVVFVWDLPKDAPSLIALCSLRLHIQSNTAPEIATEKVMFLVQGNGNSFGNLLSGQINIDLIKEPAEILQAIETFEGRKSSAVLEFRDNLREWMGQGA